jgi:hypothetical protein
VKIIVGQVEVDIINGGKITYDSNTDTISITPPYPIRRHEPAPKRDVKPKQLLIEHDKYPDQEDVPLTKTQLTERIFSLLGSSKEATPMRTLTDQCLGRGPAPNKIKYLKLLLEELVDRGMVVESLENNRRRYALA